MRRLLLAASVCFGLVGGSASAETTLKVWTISWDEVAMAAFKAMIQDYGQP